MDTTSTLADVSKILRDFAPLLSLGITTAKMIAALLQRQGVEIGTFAQEIARAEAARDNLGAALGEFHAKFPDIAPVGGLTTKTDAAFPETPVGGPASGETTTIGESPRDRH